jgi:hypothetical protein
MPKSPGEKGVAPHLDLCVGVEGFPGWQGVVREMPPGQIPDNAFYLIQNCRLTGGRLVSRGGQEKVNTSTLGASVVVEGFFDCYDLA